MCDRRFTPSHLIRRPPPLAVPSLTNSSLFAFVNTTEECAVMAKSKGANAFNYIPKVGVCQFQVREGRPV
jgi:hypothetical protein